MQQRLAQPRPWGHQQVREFAALDNLALFQQRRVVTNGFHHLQLVRYQHNGQIEPLVNIRQQSQHRGGGLGIQSAGRLVAQQHLRSGGQRPGDADALFLPAGKLRRESGGLFAEIHQLQQFAHPRFASGPRHPGNLQRHRDVIGDGAGMQQIEVLENHPGAQAIIPQRRLVQLSNILSVHQNAARGGPLQQIETADERTFAGAAAPENAVYRPFRDL